MIRCRIVSVAALLALATSLVAVPSSAQGLFQHGSINIGTRHSGSNSNSNTNTNTNSNETTNSNTNQESNGSPSISYYEKHLGAELVKIQGEHRDALLVLGPAVKIEIAYGNEIIVPLKNIKAYQQIDTFTLPSIKIGDVIKVRKSFGGYTYYAAINKSVRKTSLSGARGPLQFLPNTFSYGAIRPSTEKPCPACGNYHRNQLENTNSNAVRQQQGQSQGDPIIYQNVIPEIQLQVPLSSIDAAPEPSKPKKGPKKSEKSGNNSPDVPNRK